MATKTLDLSSGAKIGVEVALRLSMLYAAPFVIPALIVPFVGIFVIPFVILVGILPSLFIGAAIGLLLDLQFQFSPKPLSTKACALLGTVTSAIVVSIVHLVVVPNLKEVAYWFWLGIPGLVCIGAGAWVGPQIRNKLTEQSNHRILLQEIDNLVAADNPTSTTAQTPIALPVSVKIRRRTELNFFLLAPGLAMILGGLFMLSIWWQLHQCCIGNEFLVWPLIFTVLGSLSIWLGFKFRL